MECGEYGLMVVMLVFEGGWLEVWWFRLSGWCFGGRGGGICIVLRGVWFFL